MWVLLVGFDVNPVGEPDAGKPHVRFDERPPETEQRRHAVTTAPAVDSTQLPAADDDALHPAAFSLIGVLDGLQSTTPRPSGRKHHWAQHLAALATNLGEKCRLALADGAGRRMTHLPAEPVLFRFR